MTTVWDMVTAQVERNPSWPAIRGDAELSYRQLELAVRALADRIRVRTAPGSLLALDLTRPAAASTCVLAAAASGHPVLPLNTESPPLHRAAVLADARPSHVLRESGDGAVSIEPVAEDRGSAAAMSPVPGPAAAYVMYTSGSTGRPKGVVVSHQALCDRLTGLARRPGLRPGQSMLAMTALSFDISMAELLLPLVAGGCLVAAPPEARADPVIFAKVVSHYQPDVLQATPSFWRLALASGWPGSQAGRIWCGGEALTPGLAARLLPACAELWNLYGPTEATIWATAEHITSAGSVTLGPPLEGTGLVLSGGDGLVTAPGQEGEIWLFGAGLASGYLRRPDLTAASFVLGDTPAGRTLCYRTGDRARYRADGGLEFLGRADAQVKLRGHRIELGEIEAVAEQHPAVRAAAAVLRDGEQPDRAHIALLVVADPTLTVRQLRRWLAERVPPSLRPGSVSIEASLPRTAAGKLDRQALARGDGRPTVAARAEGAGVNISE